MTTRKIPLDVSKQKFIEQQITSANKKINQLNVKIKKLEC